MSMNVAVSEKRTVWIDYTNHRGERRWRHILPMWIAFELSAWHDDGPQWILEAHDLDKGALRSFALKDIHRWQTEAPQS